VYLQFRDHAELIAPSFLGSIGESARLGGLVKLRVRGGEPIDAKAHFNLGTLFCAQEDERSA